jgi:predicted O-methyltransferase YrrM
MRTTNSLRALYDNVAIRAELRWEETFLDRPNYAARPMDEIVDALSTRLSADLRALMAEPALAEIEAQVERGISTIENHPALPTVHHGDRGLARLCYAICRAIKPTYVVETGVAYGVTTSFLLRALAENGQGALHSIDRPPFDDVAASRVGALVPNALRERWTLHRAASRRILPQLLPALGQIQLFLHDSRHTYRNILWELETATPFLASNGVAVADDIERNVAFATWARRHPDAYAAVGREAGKGGLFGIGVMPEVHGARR